MPHIVKILMFLLIIAALGPSEDHYVCVCTVLPLQNLKKKSELQNSNNKLVSDKGL